MRVASRHRGGRSARSRRARSIAPESVRYGRLCQRRPHARTACRRRACEPRTAAASQRRRAPPQVTNPFASMWRCGRSQPFQLRYGAFYDTERHVGRHLRHFEPQLARERARPGPPDPATTAQLREARLYLSQPSLRVFPAREHRHPLLSGGAQSRDDGVEPVQRRPLWRVDSAGAPAPQPRTCGTTAIASNRRGPTIPGRAVCWM